jgi:hypothetical protein
MPGKGCFHQIIISTTASLLELFLGGAFLLQLLAVHNALWWHGSYGLHHVWGGYCITNHPQSTRAIRSLQNCCLDHGTS